MKIEVNEYGDITAKTNHRAIVPKIEIDGSDGWVEAPIGNVTKHQLPAEQEAEILMTTDYSSFIMTPEDAIAVGQALITLGTIAQNPTIIKEETNEN